MLYEKMCSEHRRLEQEIHSLQAQIATLPEGKLICARDDNFIKWYRSDGHTPIYIPRKERHLAEQLAVKKYLTLRSQELLHEKRALEFYLRHHSKSSSKALQLLSEESPYSKLLSPYFTPNSSTLSDWMHSPYDINPAYPEQRTHKTCANISVRSKSEALITTLLYTNKIPFRYECALCLNTVTLYPDFTIRHPVSGNYYYWEHFGLMDRPDYMKNSFSKVQLYTTNGILPSVQLITTYESREHPLDSSYVEALITHYFLSDT